jgi:hypothetical protein
VQNGAANIASSSGAVRVSISFGFRAGRGQLQEDLRSHGWGCIVVRWVAVLEAEPEANEFSLTI